MRSINPFKNFGAQKAKPAETPAPLERQDAARNLNGQPSRPALGRQNGVSNLTPMLALPTPRAPTTLGNFARSDESPDSRFKQAETQAPSQAAAVDTGGQLQSDRNAGRGVAPTPSGLPPIQED